MPDNRDPEIVNEPKKYTAEQDFDGNASNAVADDDVMDTVGNNAGDGLSYDSQNTTLSVENALGLVESSNVTLSSGSATVDTGVGTSETATFLPAIGPATDDADVAAEVRADSVTGTYQIDIVETDTSVGNPTVEYDIVRVR